MSSRHWCRMLFFVLLFCLLALLFSMYLLDIFPDRLMNDFVWITSSYTTNLSLVDPSSYLHHPCPPVSPLLRGRTNTPEETLEYSIYDLEVDLSSVLQPGGAYDPPNCKSNNRFALIVPFRDREKHLPVFLRHMHLFLQRQQASYVIFIVEQSGNAPFNRGMLMNIGVVESLRHDPTLRCFILHDVDLLPEDDRNLYFCPGQPRHMSVAIDTMNYALPYATIFGGVSAMLKEHFFLVNGFSNLYWGWGSEDDDLYSRITYHGLKVTRYPPDIARYRMLPHVKAKPNSARVDLYRKRIGRIKEDGVNSLTYKLSKLTLKPLYVHIVVDISP